MFNFPHGFASGNVKGLGETKFVRDCAIIIRRGAKNELCKEKYYITSPSQQRQIIMRNSFSLAVAVA